MRIENKYLLNKFAEDLAHFLTGYDDETVPYYAAGGGPAKYNPHDRFYGLDWPRDSLSMIGVKRMENLYSLLVDVIENDIEGDFIETGVWRGGACIFTARIFKKLKITNRNIWVCDSFQGLPKPDPRYIHDVGDTHHTVQELAISLETVQNNFKQFKLLNEQVKFVKGWFCDTLPTIDTKFSILRLDGDMYSSTIDALNNLYPKLSTNGYVIIDDYGIKNCKAAVEDYRKDYSITSPLIEIDRFSRAVFWKKT